MELQGFADCSEILRSGVYALVKGNRVIYVGKSKSMIARINAHRRAWIDRRKKEAWITNVLGIPGLLFDEIHIRPCPVHLLDELEQEMISRYQPHYNARLKKPIAPLSVVLAAHMTPYEPRVLRR